jgi:hypothetical protein
MISSPIWFSNARLFQARVYVASIIVRRLVELSGFDKT